MQGRTDYQTRKNNENMRFLEIFPDYVKEWGLYLMAGSNSEVSVQEYLNKLKGFLTFLNEDNIKDVKIEEIKVADINRFFISKKNKSKSYLKSYWFILNNFFRYMEEIGFVEENPMSHVKRIKGSDPLTKPELTEDDFRNILRAVDQGNDDVVAYRDRAILLLFMTTGMRREELCEIYLDDIDLMNNEVVITKKGNNHQRCFFSDATASAIKNWIRVRHMYIKDGENPQALFLSNRGKTISGRTVYDIVDKYSTAGLGYRISPHKIRAGFCTILDQKGWGIQAIQHAVGHANVSTTQRYIRSNPENVRREAANAIF